jgi:hypothetical protein
MHRYYFHVRDRVSLIRDPNGLELSSPLMAIEEAERQLREIEASARRLGLTQKVAIEVTDDEGHPIFADGVSVRSREP